MSKQNNLATTARQEELLRGLPERMDIRVDWAFRHFFGKKKHLRGRGCHCGDLPLSISEFLIVLSLKLGEGHSVIN